MTPTIIYLHGYASIGNGPKSAALKLAFGADSVFSPDLPIDPTQVIAIVSEIVSKVTHFPIVFVGTSLGGFWANYFAQKYDAPCVIINPSLHPSRTMSTRIGIACVNYNTGVAFDVTQDHVDQYVACETAIANNTNGALINVFLARDDDLLNYRETLHAIPFAASTEITDTGGHRYDALWHTVIEKVKKIVDTMQ